MIRGYVQNKSLRGTDADRTPMTTPGFSMTVGTGSITLNSAWEIPTGKQNSPETWSENYWIRIQ